jgi:hypothetical protein
LLKVALNTIKQKNKNKKHKAPPKNPKTLGGAGAASVYEQLGSH